MLLLLMMMIHKGRWRWRKKDIDNVKKEEDEKYKNKHTATHAVMDTIMEDLTTYSKEKKTKRNQRRMKKRE